MIRRLEPVGYEFEHKGEPLVLDEFEVVQQFGGLLDIRRLG